MSLSLSHWYPGSGVVLQYSLKLCIIFYKTHTNQNGTGILIKNSRVYRTRAELTQADLTQADLTQGQVDPHLLGKG